jgi:hypothetical protein
VSLEARGRIWSEWHGSVCGKRKLSVGRIPVGVQISDLAESFTIGSNLHIELRFYWIWGDFMVWERHTSDGSNFWKLQVLREAILLLVCSTVLVVVCCLEIGINCRISY